MMNCNYNFRFLTCNQEGSRYLTLKNGKLNHGHLILRKNVPKNESNRFTTILIEKQQEFIEKSHFKAFVKTIFSLPLFGDYDKRSLKAFKAKILEISEIENICSFYINLIHLNTLHQKFSTLQNQKDKHEVENLETALQTIAIFHNIMIHANSFSPSQDRQIILDKLQELKVSEENWLNIHLKPCFEQKIPKKLIKRLCELANLEKTSTITWTVEDVQKIIAHIHSVNKYKRLYFLGHTTLGYINNTLTSTLDYASLKSSSLFERACSLTYYKCIQEVKTLGETRTNAIIDVVEATRQNVIINQNENNESQGTFALKSSFFKIFKPSSEFEESTIGKKFALSQSKGTVPSYSFQNLHLPRLGISLDVLAPPQRRFPTETMSYSVQVKFAENLCDENLYNLWTFIPYPKSLKNKYEKFLQARHSYSFFCHKKFQLKFDEKLVLTLSFNELIRYEQHQKLPHELKITMEGDNNFYSPYKFFENYTFIDDKKTSYALKKAKKFYYQVDKSRDSFFTIKIENEWTENLIKRCEKQCWEYCDKSGNWIKVTFQKLYELWVCKKIFDNTFVRANEIESTIKNEKIFGLYHALNLRTYFVIPELILNQTMDSPKGFYSKNFPIQQISGKPNLKYMRLFSEIKPRPLALEAVFQKLIRPQTIHTAFLILYHQFLDLHGMNLGISPLIDENFLSMNQYQFISYPKSQSCKQQTLTKLSLEYLNNEIDDETVIDIVNPQHSQILYKTTIKMCPPLKSALNLAWRIVIFDGDYVNGEDENLMTYSWWDQTKLVEKKEFTLLPLRNFLLGNENFRNQHLNLEELQLIKKTLHDKTLDNWCFNKHHFSWRFIKVKHHETLEKLVLEKISKPEYTLTYYQRKNFDIDNKLLKSKIAEDLSDVSMHQEFWKTIQELLLDYGASGWFRQNASQEMQFSEKVDLTLDTMEAKKQRFRFIKGLIPTETYRQILGRRNRKNNCLRFFDFYDHLLSMKKAQNATTIINTIEEIIRDKVIPFSTIKRNFLLQKMSVLKNAVTYDQAQLFLDLVLKEYIPTYGKLANVMYPFLADNWEVVRYSLENPDDIAIVEKVGYFRFSIEDTIKKAKSRCHHNPEIYKFIVQFEQRVEAELERQNKEFGFPCFLGRLD